MYVLNKFFYYYWLSKGKEARLFALPPYLKVFNLKNVQFQPFLYNWKHFSTQTISIWVQTNYESTISYLPISRQSTATRIAPRPRSKWSHIFCHNCPARSPPSKLLHITSVNLFFEISSSGERPNKNQNLSQLRSLSWKYLPKSRNLRYHHPLHHGNIGWITQIKIQQLGVVNASSLLKVDQPKQRWNQL